jgi:hypothetical protein
MIARRRADVDQGRDWVEMRQWTTVASASGSTRPEAVVDHIRMLARKQPFTLCGKLGQMVWSPA